MNRLWPQSLAGRLIIWLMLVFGMALLLAVGLNRFNNERLLTQVAQENAATRLTMLSRVLEQRGPTEWQQTLHAATSNDFHFTIDENVFVVDDGVGVTTGTTDVSENSWAFAIRQNPKEIMARGKPFKLEFLPRAGPIIEKQMGTERQVYVLKDAAPSTAGNINTQVLHQITIDRLERPAGDPKEIWIDSNSVRQVDNAPRLAASEVAKRINQRHTAMGANPVNLAVKLDDGRWLKGAFQPKNLPLWSLNSALFLAALALAIGGVIVLVVRSETKPMQRLAIAAEALGRGETQAPLAENGPREVRVAVKAFNLMGERLGRYVQDRTRMLAAMSHDLRTPLTALRLRAEMIDEPETREKFIETIEEMHRITEASLSFAREEDNAEDTVQTDLTALVQHLCEEAVSMGKDASLSANTPPLAVPVRPAALRRALRNLIDNAVRYGNQARLSIEPEKSEIRIMVEDDGPGIAEDKLEDVFAPFVRLENSRNHETGGAGLGLAIARTIARAHGGDVVLQNRDGGGLRAVLSVPWEERR